MSSLRLIGLAGTAGAGKDTVADLLCKMYGMQNLSTSEALRAITRYIYRAEPTAQPVRDQLYAVGNYIRVEIDPSTLVKLCVLQAQVLHLEWAVITGLRSIGEAEAIRAAGGTIIGVTADARIRYDRIFSRARDADARKSLEEFLEQDQRENRGTSDSGSGRGIQAIIDGADVVVENNGTLAELQQTLNNRVAVHLNL